MTHTWQKHNNFLIILTNILSSILEPVLSFTKIPQLRVLPSEEKAIKIKE